MYKQAIISNFLGEIRNRFMVYQGPRDLDGKFESAKQIKGLSGLELAYPQDFADRAHLDALLKNTAMRLRPSTSGAAGTTSGCGAPLPLPTRKTWTKWSGDENVH